MIPNNYWQLEYIESTGTQYIDTGIRPDATNKIVVEYQYTSINANQQNGTNAGTNGIIIGINSSSNFIIYSNSNETSYGSADLLRHTFSADLKNGVGLLDNTSKAITTFTGTSSTSFSIFKRYNSSTICRARLYSLQFYSNDVLTYNFIPTMRKSDNVIGLYDEVNNVFYTNSGTGTFIGGGVKNAPLNIKLTSVPFVIKYITNNVNIIAYFKSIANCRYKVNGTWKNGTMYIKENGTWKSGTPKIKVNGAWKEGG